ncbi:MAG: SMP-30/gluconolactonase/LRE family protein, partial [Planctomycetota bacterium]|nr:SMP-30/gluconolactonase/LRE family protein [Planctomycetota bacterium]
MNRQGKPIAGDGNAEFRQPADVALDKQGDMYIVDRGNARVQKISAAGVFLRKWGTAGVGDGQFGAPEAICLDASGSVYVADTGNNRVQKFDANGGFQMKWGMQGALPGQFQSPRGVAVDAQGRLYIADAGNNRIQRFVLQGQTATADLVYGERGEEAGEFKRPSGVVAIAGSRLFTAEKVGERVQEFAVSEEGSEASLLFAGIVPDPETPDVTARVLIKALNGQAVNGGFALNPAAADILAAEVSCLFPDGAAMSFGEVVFTETAAESRAFWVGVGVISQSE